MADDLRLPAMGRIPCVGKFYRLFETSWRRDVLKPRAGAMVCLRLKLRGGTKFCPSPRQDVRYGVTVSSLRYCSLPTNPAVP
ncbi:MAG TPA: hypothetical protein VGC82_15645, partial [Rhodopila sp.]